VRVDRPDDTVEHRLGAHPSAGHAQPQPGDRVGGELGCRANPFDVVAIIGGFAKRRHLRCPRQDVVQAPQRREYQRIGIPELLRFNGELHPVEQQLVRNPVLPAQSLGVQRVQARQCSTLARVLAFERGERQVRQKIVVTGDAADRGLDRIAPERRVEVFVQQDFELCCGFGRRVVGLGVHAVDPEGGEKREEDNRRGAGTKVQPAPSGSRDRR
jgi:hypothetical protein